MQIFSFGDVGVPRYESNFTPCPDVTLTRSFQFVSQTCSDITYNLNFFQFYLLLAS